MVGILDLAVSLGGLIIPPAFDFIKKKFVKESNDTPERTIGTLATTNPEAVSGYVESLSKLKDASIRFFNRDVIGTPSQWVVNLRAAIRPIGVIISFGILSCIAFEWMSNVEGIRLSCETIITSWFGSRITLTK